MTFSFFHNYTDYISFISFQYKASNKSIYNYIVKYKNKFVQDTCVLYKLSIKLYNFNKILRKVLTMNKKLKFLSIIILLVALILPYSSPDGREDDVIDFYSINDLF